MSGYEGPHLSIGTLHILSLFSQEFQFETAFQGISLKITFKHQQGQHMNMCVCMCVILLLAYGEIFNDSLTVGGHRVACHLQVLTYFELSSHFLPQKESG